MNEPPVDYIELNLSNYGPDDVCQLNEWGIWASGELDRLNTLVWNMERELDELKRIDNPAEYKP